MEDKYWSLITPKEIENMFLDEYQLSNLWHVMTQLKQEDRLIPNTENATDSL